MYATLLFMTPLACDDLTNLDPNLPVSALALSIVAGPFCAGLSWTLSIFEDVRAHVATL